MTQPNTVDMTFDTSLIDVKPANTSFSTTESDPASDYTPSYQSSSTKTYPSSSAMPPSTPVQHIPTQLAYDQWASVYDTDGNMLQAIDDLELYTLLPFFLSSIMTSTTKELRILDLGCGTGRNTSKLVSHSYPSGTSVHITGLDFSQGMLDIARSKLTPLAQEKGRDLELLCCDPFQEFLPTPSGPLPAEQSISSPIPAAQTIKQQHALISTLVLEHIPLSTFFSTLSSLLLPRGSALVSNMHADMGTTSQAGFLNADGVKVRGESYVYTVEETVQAAKEAGFEVLNVTERQVKEEDVSNGAVGTRGRKWLGTKVWYALVLAKLA